MRLFGLGRQHVCNLLSDRDNHTGVESCDLPVDSRVSAFGANIPPRPSAKTRCTVRQYLRLRRRLSFQMLTDLGFQLVHGAGMVRQGKCRTSTQPPFEHLPACDIATALKTPRQEDPGDLLRILVTAPLPCVQRRFEQCLGKLVVLHERHQVFVGWNPVQGGYLPT